MEKNNGIVLAMFGTSVEEALCGLFNIRNRVAARFPNTPVCLAFTSNIIRRIWRQRADDPDYLRAHPDIPEDVLQVEEPLAAVAALQNEGIVSIIVQQVQIAPSEEFFDLASYAERLDSINTVNEQSGPFCRLLIGRPALGTFGARYPYGRDIVTAAGVLAGDARQAEERNAALVYMGHGNKHQPTGDVYAAFCSEMNRKYPEVLTVVATLEEGPSIDDAIARLNEKRIEQVILKPFMVVAGKHTLDDMLGRKPQSLKNRLEEAGFSVWPVVQGLGEQDDFADIFVRHINDAATDADILLR